MVRPGRQGAVVRVYADIVPGQRIVHTPTTCTATTPGSRYSVATIEFEAVGDTTLLTLTEQGVHLDGLDAPADREHGTKALLDALGSHLNAT